METIRSLDTLTARLSAWRADGARLGLVMLGAAGHAGHAALLQAARDNGEKVIAVLTGGLRRSDGSANARAPEIPVDESLEFLQGCDCDLAYIPGLEETYPAGHATGLRIEKRTDVLCGGVDARQFDRAALEFVKLTNATRADGAYVGDKDWQMFQVLSQTTRDLNLPVALVNVPTRRAEDGLALANRNRHLSAEEREIAPALHAVLREAAARIAMHTPTELVCAEAQETLFMQGFKAVDYLECRDAFSLRLAPSPGTGARVFGAARLGDVLLIDNVEVPAPGAPAA